MQKLPYLVEKTIKSFDGTEIYYNISYGQNKEKTLIFLHGLGSDSQCWNKVRAFFFKKGYSTIAVDLRGHGFSGRAFNAEFYEISSFSKDLLEINKTEKLNDAVLIGHSLGAMVALTLESTFPHTAKALVLISMNPFPPYKGAAYFNSRFFKKMFGVIAQKIPDIHVEGHSDTERFIGSWDIDLKRLAADALHTSLKSYVYIWQMVLSFNAMTILNKIKVPTQVLVGRNDIIVPLQDSQILAKNIENAELKVIKRANHVLVISKPLAVSNAIWHYLQKIGF